jgi:hypothetical protein
VAKVPQRRCHAQLPKDEFQLDLDTMTCGCPGGHTTQTLVSISSGDRYGAPGVPLRACRCSAAVCAASPLRAACVRARSGRGRLVMLHPEEALLLQARAVQRSPAFTPYRTLRQVAAHRLARLLPRSVRDARYVGRAKTLGQLLLAASEANLTLVATTVGRMRHRQQRRARDTTRRVDLLVSVLVMCSFAVVPRAAGMPWTPTREGGFRPRL